ncbi:DnaB-like helicase N-terminal domain-containing protein [Kitasatospora sp. NPDC097605]|uniref:DnaB-like helicase N-terminal domain-containing protein n=1 Tax=Kitasatospora sp. NPDC097605 TaxID=3157226 RepID=UPI00331A8CEE
MTPQMEAEQALLGAILLDPAQLGAVAWLEPQHFYRPAHTALYQALIDQAAAGHPGLDPEPTEARARWATDAMTAAAEACPAFTAGYGHTLIAACPVSSHAAVYGRMVLESWIRRQVHEHAHRLQHASRTGDLNGVLDLTVALRQAVHELTARWGALDKHPRPLPGQWPLELSDAIRRTTTVDETALLTSATASPSGLHEITRWLRPGDFLDPGRGAVYQALAALAHRDEPIDVLTVLWEAQRQGAIAAGAVTADGVRAATRNGFTGDSRYWGERVLRASVLRQTSASAGVVRLLSRDTSLAAARLLGCVLPALERAEAVQERWRAATGAPLRAGPPPTSSRSERREAARTRIPATFPRVAAPPSPAEAAALPGSPIRSNR